MNSSRSPETSIVTSPQDGTADLIRSLCTHRWALSLLLFGATFLLYCPMGSYEFINYDDQLYVTENYMVQQGLTLKGLKWAFTSFTASNWHPVTMLSHTLDVELFGLNPAAHHYVSLLLHSLNAASLFLFLSYLTGRSARSFVVSALFAVHPLSTESVMWIAERKNLLCTLFFILAMAAYVSYARNPGWRRYLAVTGLYLLALLSKPMVVTFPFVLLLLDYWPLRRWRAAETSSVQPKYRIIAALPTLRPVLEKAPWFLMAALSSLITLFVQRRDGAVSAGYLPLWARVGNAALSYARYLWKTVFPAKLCIFYPHPKLGIPWREVTFAAVILIVITLLVMRYRANAYLTVGWLWFLGTLVPVIGIVQAGSQAMADRYAYIPFIGILFAVVWAASDLLHNAHVSRKLVVPLTFVLLVALGWRTRTQESYWQNSVTLFTHALDVTKNNPVAHLSLAIALAEQDLPEESISHIRAALAINPHDAMALQTLALYHIYHGDTVRALDELNTAAILAKHPVLQAHIHMNLAALYSKLGQMEKAKSEYRQAILLWPEDYKPYLNLGVHLYLEGKYSEALEDFAQSVAVFPTSTAYYYAGETLQAEGKLQEAEESYRKALQISPQYGDAQRALLELLARMQPGSSSH